MKRKEKFSKKRKLNALYYVLIVTAVICTAVAGITAYMFLNNYNIKDSEPKHSNLLPERTDDGGVASAVYKAQTEESQPDTISSGTDGQMEIEIPPSSLPENHKGFTWEVLKDGTVINEFERAYSIVFGSPEEYSRLRGVTTFRGNNYRNSPCYGFADVTEEKLESIWFSKTGYIDIWTGVGWTGQPAVVKWDPELKNIMNIFPGKKSKQGLIEVL
jgi:hypothetical protein